MSLAVYPSVPLRLIPTNRGAKPVQPFGVELGLRLIPTCVGQLNGRHDPQSRGGLIPTRVGWVNRLLLPVRGMLLD